MKGQIKYSKTPFFIFFAIIFHVNMAMGQPRDFEAQVKKEILDCFANFYNPTDSTYQEIKVDLSPQEHLRWGRIIVHPILEISIDSKQSFYKRHRESLDSFLQKKLKEKQWDIKTVSNDHYGAVEYRILNQAQRSTLKFFYIFIAKQINPGWDWEGDWDSHIYVLSSHISLLNDNISHENYFEQIVEWINDHKRTIDIEAQIFDISLKDSLYQIEFDDQKFKSRLSLYCRFGPGGTDKGWDYWQRLPGIFISYLNSKNYSVSIVSENTFSGPGTWQKILYFAQHKKRKDFKFIFEKEANPMMSMGYANIIFVEE